MLYDIHIDLGPRTRVASFDEAFEKVRERWPGARAEGSTGFQRSFWTGPSDEAELVGHGWEVRSRKGGWWLRVKLRTAEA